MQEGLGILIGVFLIILLFSVVLRALEATLKTLQHPKPNPPPQLFVENNEWGSSPGSVRNAYIRIWLKYFLFGG